MIAGTIVKLPRSRHSDTETYEIEEAQFTITCEVDRSGYVHEARVLIMNLDGIGQDPIDCTEELRKSKVYTAKIMDFVTTFDWVSRELQRRYGDRMEET